MLESIEKMTTTLPDEPTFEKTTDDAKKRIAEMKFKSKFDRWLTHTENIEKELKQIYSKYFGQCDEDMKATLAEDASFDKANKEKDVITLRKILQSVNFSYRSSKEPIKTMWEAKADFIKLHQQKPTRVGVSFNTVGEDNDGTALAIKGGPYSGIPCAQCGCTNHLNDNCLTKRHDNGDLLYNEGGVGDE